MHTLVVVVVGSNLRLGEAENCIVHQGLACMDHMAEVHIVYIDPSAEAVSRIPQAVGNKVLGLLRGILKNFHCFGCSQVRYWAGRKVGGKVGERENWQGAPML